MKNDQILSLISEYCREADMAETTFGRRAVNDGKLVHRLREGKRITIDTLDRIQAYIATSMPGGVPLLRGIEVPPEKRDPRGNFRFFENRQRCGGHNMRRRRSHEPSRQLPPEHRLAGVFLRLLHFPTPAPARGEHGGAPTPIILGNQQRQPEPFRQIAGDVTGAVVTQQPWLVRDLVALAA